MLDTSVHQMLTDADVLHLEIQFFSPQPLDCELAEAVAEIKLYKIKCHKEPLL